MKSRFTRRPLVSSLSLAEKTAIVQRYNAGEAAQAIAKSISVSDECLIRFLKKEPSVKWRGKRTFEFNQNFFSKIESEAQAYFLGFICADGHNSLNKHTRCLQIELQKRDDYILQHFADLLNYKGKIRTTKHYTKKPKIKKEYSRLRIYSKKMSDDLFNLGVCNNKTQSLRWPSFLDKKLINHFLRGLSDGDGCIRSDFEKNRKYGWIMPSSLKFCFALKKFLFLNLGVNSRIRRIQSLANPNLVYGWIEISGGIQVEKFLQYLYKDSTIYLKRKYDLFIRVTNTKQKHNVDIYKKITIKEAAEIKSRLLRGKETLRQIAKDYNVSHGVVACIKSGHSWKQA